MCAGSPGGRLREEPQQHDLPPTEPHHDRRTKGTRSYASLSNRLKETAFKGREVIRKSNLCHFIKLFLETGGELLDYFRYLQSLGAAKVLSLANVVVSYYLKICLT